MKKTKSNKQKKPLINEKILSKEVRVVTEEHSAVLPLFEAIDLAKSKNMDLILITPNANPPICKIMELGKYLYSLSKHNKQQHIIKEKEVHFSVTIADNDYLTKINHAKSFLSKQMNVKVIVELEGRENSHPELAYDLMNKIATELDPVSKFNSQFKLQNNKIQVHFTPKKHG